MLEYLCNKCKVQIWGALSNILWAQVSFAAQLLCLVKYHFRSYGRILGVKCKYRGMLWSKSFDKIGVGFSILYKPTL